MASMCASRNGSATLARGSQRTPAQVLAATIPRAIAPTRTQGLVAVSSPSLSVQGTLRVLAVKPLAAQAGSSGAPEGQMTSALMDQMKSKIGEALETDKVSIADVYGDGRHVTIDVVSNLFEGKGSMQRQRMVYKAIWLELQDAVHAVDSMTTKTPGEQ